jgi:hemerythrin-like domain-containing protein
MDSVSTNANKSHRRGNAFFHDMEDHARIGNWRQAKESFRILQQALEQHLTMEENILFPAFEEIIGNRSGPTGIMRMENGAIRNLLVRMMYAMAQRDHDDFCWHIHRLLDKLQQHHLREEGTLYLMADRVLVSKRVGIMDAMDAINAPCMSDME